jgi:hypothetical protein
MVSTMVPEKAEKWVMLKAASKAVQSAVLVES